MLVVIRICDLVWTWNGINGTFLFLANLFLWKIYVFAAAANAFRRIRYCRFCLLYVCCPHLRLVLCNVQLGPIYLIFRVLSSQFYLVVSSECCYTFYALFSLIILFSPHSSFFKSLYLTHAHCCRLFPIRSLVYISRIYIWFDLLKFVPKIKPFIHWIQQQTLHSHFRMHFVMGNGEYRL